MDTSATHQEETDLRSEVELIANVMESMPSGADAALYFREDSVRLEWALVQALERAFEKGTADGHALGEEQGRQEALDEIELQRNGRLSWSMIFGGIVLATILLRLIWGGFLR